MLRKNIMCALAVVACAAWASEAYGYGHSHGSHGSHGSSGGYSSGHSSGGYSSGHSSGGYSSGHSSGHRHGHSSGWGRRRRWGHSSGYSSGHSSGGRYYTSYGSSGGSWGSWGSHGSSGGSSGGYYSAPAAPGPGPGPSDLPAGEVDAAAYLQSNNSALIAVTVPEGAEVYINDVATTSTGTQRRYISRGLETGKNYTYRVTAKVFRNGKQYQDTKVVDLSVGQSSAIAFDPNLGNIEQVVPVSTTLIVNMPSDAKLILAGRDTNSSGEQREFTTTHLSDGKTWESYVVRGEWEVDGQTLVTTQYVNLKAGEVTEVQLDFADTTIASRD